MSANEFSVIDYTFEAVARTITNPKLLHEAKAFVAGAPKAKPDITNAKRTELRGSHGAFPQKIIPLNTQAFDALKKKHLGDIKTNSVEDNALIELSKAIAHDSFYGDEPTATKRPFGADIDEHIFQAVADLAVSDGFRKEVDMAKAFITNAEKTVVEYDASIHNGPAGQIQVTASQIPEVSTAFEALKTASLTGQFNDDMRSNVLTALEDAAVKVAQSRMQARPVAKPAAVMA